jgi:hypothetical protein
MRRLTEWGNWGLTFYTKDDAGNIIILGQRFFGVGAQGPCEGFLGSKERQVWIDMSRNWMQNGVLPDTLDTRLATKEAA